MISISFKRDTAGEPVGIRCSGHAGYARAGKDIVCASVSILVQNTLNSIEAFTDDGFDLDVNESKGYICFSFKQDPSKEGKLFLKSLELGLTELEKQYKKYLQIFDWEV